MIEHNWNRYDILRYLKSKTGYIKKGPKWLRVNLLKQGVNTTVKECRLALREARQEVETGVKKDGTPPKILFYDIETSYNIVKAWRTGYQVTLLHNSVIEERKIICISYKWEGDDNVYNLQWDTNQCDKSMLQEFVSVLNEADLIVAHNGDKFDIKWIRTRALAHGIPMLLNYPQFDTLKVAKKKFYFNSNKLDYISEYLGFENKLPTGMKLWDDIILRKDADAMDKMIDYCNQDVVLLEKVYNKLVTHEAPKVHAGVLAGKTKETSPIAGGENLELVKTVTTARGTVKRIMRDLDNNRLFEMSNTHYNKYMDGLH